MKNSEFKKFKESVKTAPYATNCPLWFAGFLWLDLTEKQFAEVTKICIDRGFPVRMNLARGRNEVVLPSGIGLLFD